MIKMYRYWKLSSSDTPKPSKIRKYVTKYIEFHFIESSGAKPMCVICLQVLANEAMKLAKLTRHLLTKHPEYSNNPKDFFIRKGEEYFHQRTRLTNLATTSERAQRASYLVAQRIPKFKKAHTIAPELIFPAVVDM